MLDADPRPRAVTAADDVVNGRAADSIAAAIWGPTHRNLTIGLILTVSMAAFEALAVATVLPAVVNDIGGLQWYGWVFSGFMLANLVSIIAAGRAADQEGVARPFVLGSGLFVLGLLGAGVAPAMAVVVASRIAQGLGAGAISSVAYVSIARAYPAHARPRMLAMLSSAWVVPGLIGPALAAAIAAVAPAKWVTRDAALASGRSGTLTAPRRFGHLIADPGTTEDTHAPSQFRWLRPYHRRRSDH